MCVAHQARLNREVAHRRSEPARPRPQEGQTRMSMPVRSSNRCHHGRLSFSAAVSSRGECGQHSACRLEFGLYIAASAQAEVANSGESLGQHMQQESPNELHSFQGHLLALSRGGVVFEGEGDLAMVNSHDALVGNGDAMGISGLAVPFEIPRFRILKRRVVLLSPSLAAAPFGPPTTQLVWRRVAMMCARSASASVAPLRRPAALQPAFRPIPH